MGLLDTLFGKAGATPVFNPNDPMQGFYDPTEEERKQARKMAALQAGAGMLMNNTGNYGAFAPALGAGIAQGVQGYQQGLQIGPERRMKEMQQRLYGQQIEAQMKRAAGDQDEDAVASGIFKTVFQDAGYDPETGGFLPVAASGQEVGTSPLSGTPITQDDFATPKPANPMDSILDELGWGAGRKKFFMSQYKADPKAAMKNLERAYIELDRANRRGKTEARDVIAKEKAMAEAMGMPVGEYLKTKMNKSGVNVTVQNYGEPKPVQMPDGSQALVRFGKDPNAPPVIVPFMPAASDTEQMTAGYADRMVNSERVLSQLGERGNPSYTTAIVGGIAGEAGRSIASSPEQQMHRQAQEDWVRAKLRKESGAVIADEEMEREIKTYFPQPWDKPETIKQKARARQIAIESMKKTAGPAMPTQSRQAAPSKPAASGVVRKYNPATGRIE